MRHSPARSHSLARSTWLLTMVSGSVLATQFAVDQDSMQLVDDRNTSLASNIALRDAAGARSDAEALAAMFAEIEAFYAQKGQVNDAVSWSRQIRELADDISTHVAASDFDQAAENAVTLSKVCKSCHSIYK